MTFVSCNFLVPTLQCKNLPIKTLKTTLLTGIFFITGLAAQKDHFRQKQEFNRLSVFPLYNVLDRFLNIADLYFKKSALITIRILPMQREPQYYIQLVNSRFLNITGVSNKKVYEGISSRNLIKQEGVLIATGTIHKVRQHFLGNF